MFQLFAPEASFILLSSLDVLESAISAAINVHGNQVEATMDIFREFRSCLKSEAHLRRCASFLFIRTETGEPIQNGSRVERGQWASSAP